jgi:hypothetical protein
MRQTIVLHNAQTGHAAYTLLWPKLKANLLAGRKLVLSVKPETRSDAANRLLHATLSDIAKQIEWAGKKRDVDVWKRLLTAAWLRTRNEHIELLPAADGNGVDIVFRHTSQLTRAECSELQEYIYSWGIEHGVRFTAPEYETT